MGAFARAINAAERHWNRPERSTGQRRLLGVLTMALLLACVGGVCWFAQVALVAWLGGWSWIAIASLAYPGLAQRSLHDHVRPVATALDAGDVIGARQAVGMIVGRDTQALDEAGVARAAIESLAESFCDGVVAPLFWLLVAGLPGLWVYKAINTADSLIGHREPRWRAFGWAAARIDDGANLLPARLGGVLICLAAGRGWRVMSRDAHEHASPNAGWTEAAMAGALDLRLAGPVSYDGVAHEKPWIGDGGMGAGAADIKAALRLYRRACLLLWAIAALVSFTS